MDLISSFTNDVVRKALGGVAKRHTAVASNIANADTPGYRHKGVAFEESLNQAIEGHRGTRNQSNGNDSELQMTATDGKHFSSARTLSLEDIQPQMSEVSNLAYRNDGNSVDIELEMAELAKNTQKYTALTNIQGRMMRSIRGVINNSNG
ncbi:MAG: flagellar basal body rod protein FlgB [Vampirovibrio sp.]|nr:flagellar basal body rod protein FlgB [Vampirovibrio sp.]